MSSRQFQSPLLLGLLATGVVLGWAYWTTLLDIGERWTNDPQYSHGFLVPVFAGYLLWRRRNQLQTAGFHARWWGVGIVLVAIGLRFAGHYFYLSWLDAISLLVALTGITAAVGGRNALNWAAPAILFLVFMVPLPFQIQIMLGGTLQRIATVLSTYVLQTLGVPAVAEGNVILLSETRLGIVEACNGLSMMVTFFALATAVAILAPRTTLERVVIVLSAVPIAVAANVVRISLTGILFEANQGELARVVFHDLAGWLMMPVALAMLLAELFILKRSIIPTPETVGS